MQNTPEFRALASVVEYWNTNMDFHTQFLVESLPKGKECLLIVANQAEEEMVGQWIGDKVKVFTLVDAKAGKLPKPRLTLPMVISPLATQQMLIEMSGLGMRNSEFAKRDVYEALLTNKMIKPEFQKQIYIRIKEIEEKT